VPLATSKAFSLLKGFSRSGSRLLLCLPALLIASCSLSAPGQTPLVQTPTSSSKEGAALFLDSDYSTQATAEPGVIRFRFVRLNLDLLLDENGEARDLSPDYEITINLFADTLYTGIIEQVSVDAGATTWIGFLKDVAYSNLLMVHASGAFIGHFASPAGIYEVSYVTGDVYRVIQIDQDAFKEG